VLGILERSSPDSARTKNPVATMTATQKINLAAFDIFMLMVQFCTPAFPGFPCKTETQLTPCDSAQGYCLGASKKRKLNV
jgi:hypothetical protein